jgi:hypothetical protein
MKATFDLEPELYAAAERLAKSQAKTLGQVVSELLRRALGPSRAEAVANMAELERRNGFDVFVERAGEQATVETVRRLCAEEAI